MPDTKQNIIDAIDLIKADLENLKDMVAGIECEYPEEPEEPDEPSQPVIPVGIDCLSGPTPPATNMIPAEASEGPWLAARAAFRTTMKNSPSGSILFIGDSQIATMNVADVSPFAVNLGISGESSRQLLFRLNENDIDNQPNLIHRAGAVVIETFVNDLGDQATYGSAQNAITTIEQYMLPRLAQWVSGKVVIICPTKVGQKSPPFWTSNAAIETINTAIKATFANRPEVVVVDINPIVAPDGWLLPEYSTDKHHLNTPLAQQTKVDATKAALLSVGLSQSALSN